MRPEELLNIDHELHDVVVQLVHEGGAQDVGWLARRARKIRRDARVNEDSVWAVVDCSTLLFVRPDDTIDHLLNALDGCILTHRVRSDLAGRTDLWLGLGMQPLLNVAALHEIPLMRGGHARRMASGEEVLVGPPGWLPDVRRFGLVGLRVTSGRLDVEPVSDQELPSPAEQQHVRELIAGHYRRERLWNESDDLESRPGELVRALTLALLEDPDLLRRPHPPLDELLYDPLEVDADAHHWRDSAAVRHQESVAFSIRGMPFALHMELRARAKAYGMSVDQFVVAVLGHLAWRTPFAEDMQDSDHWDPDYRPKPKLSVLPTSADPR
jgi:hypothetical protein